MPRYSIEPLETHTVQAIRPLIEAYGYKPYNYLRGLSNEQLSNFVLEEINKCLGLADGSYIYLARKGREVVGLVVLRLLPWDKQIFKKEMAAIDYLIAIGSYEDRINIADSLLSKLSDKCKDLKIEHLSIRLDTADLPCIHILEGAGFKLMDILVTYCFDFSKPYNKDSKYSCNIREQEVKDIGTVASITKISFQNYIDRFHSDPTLDDENCDQLYVEWAKNSCLRNVADQVVVAEMNGEVIAFATYKLHKRISYLSGLKVFEVGELIAVSPKGRRGGIYTSLVKYGMDWSFEQSSEPDMTRFIIKAQVGNTSVQRAWSNLGLKLCGSQVTFHKWL